jgi:nitroreductase
MRLLDAIENRRSIKKFTPRAVTRAELEALLDAAILAPNHGMTQPWGFIVMGEEARRAYGDVLGARRAARIEDPEAAATVRERSVRGMVETPAIIAVTMNLDDDPETREEDYAATFMAIQNMTLAAVANGLGTQIKTGAVMEDPRLREALGVPEGRRIVALVFVGEHAEVPAPKARTPAAEKTTWLP